MNIDDYESLPTTSIPVNMTAGAFAGILEHCIMYPLDSVKTRMQSLSPKHAGYNISATLRNMIKKEGIMRPVRGVTAVVAGAGPAHALYFASYELTKEFFTKFTTNNHLNYMASGVVATLIHDAISNPTEVIKQRMQMYNSPYKSVVACMRGVYINEGFSAFYRSYATQLVMNIPNQIIHFTTYEFFQNMLNHERKYNPPVHVIAGGAAGACAAAITTPLDVVKTLLNTQETGFTKGMVDAMRQIYTMAGPMGFFKGMAARVLYSMPATAICWSTYEFFKFYLCGMDHDKYKSSISGKNALQVRETDNSLEDTDGIAYVLPSTPTLEQTSTTSQSTQIPTTHTPTLNPSPPTPTGGSLKTVCELTSTVTTPAINLNTRHTSDIKSFDRAGFRSSQ